MARDWMAESELLRTLLLRGQPVLGEHPLVQGGRKVLYLRAVALDAGQDERLRTILREYGR